MHIAFQRGGGRGVYELVGGQSEYSANRLEGWTLYLRWPDGIVRETGLEVEGESGKPRLRSLWSPAFQIGRMVASMLMLPAPIRTFLSASSGLPVARTKEYVLTRLGFGPETEFAGITDIVTIDPAFVDLDNLTDKESIGVEQRWRRIEAVYSSIERLPAAVLEQVELHRAYMASGQPVTGSLEPIVSSIMRALALANANWDSATDPLPGLEQLLGISPSLDPSLPPPDALGEDEPLVSARSAHQYRLAKMRGSSGRRFSTQIRAAYADRCAFCGAKYGGVRGVRSGVDAAHILAWSKYDLDVVPNGMSLCKLHHWAFDEALLMPVYDGSDFVLKFTELSTQFETDALSKLGQNEFAVPANWLPTEKSDWPSKTYLERLYADLAIIFSA